MKPAPSRSWMLIACLFAAFGSAPTWAQHPGPGGHSIPSDQPSATPQAGPAGAKVEFENDAIVVVRIRMAPHEKTPMHDITSARLVVWLTNAELRDTQPDGTTNEIRRHAGELDWVPVQRHAGENLSNEPLEFLAILPKTTGAAVAK
jgi:hypothetical protein